MVDIVSIRSHRHALKEFTWDALWSLFDGNRDRLNLARECVDHHVGRGLALRIQFADAHREEHDVDAIKRGAVAVPLFTWFGPEGVALRVEDWRPPSARGRW